MKRNGNRILLLESCIILFLLAVIAVLLLQTTRLKKDREISLQEIEANQEIQIVPSEEATGAEIVDEIVIQESEVPQEQEVEEQFLQEPMQEGKKIVVFGDSIWDGWRDETGIAYQVAEQTGATVYNCAIGGSRATSDSNNTDIRGEWNSQSLNTMMYIARGELSAEGQLDGIPAMETLKEVDFSTVDYLIFSYGLNDYFFDVPLDSDEGMFEMDTYMGALRHAANKMREAYPNLQIIFITPTYCDMWAGEEDCTNHNFGSGVLPDYVNGMITASEQVNTYLLNMYEKMELNANNLKDYSDDGVHLNQAGREKYAYLVSEYINSIM